MKSIIFLFAGFTKTSLVGKHAFDTVFSNKSAFERSLSWATLLARDLNAPVYIAVTGESECSVRDLTSKDTASPVHIIKKEKWTISTLLNSMLDACKESGCESAVYSIADRPFINLALSEEVIRTHETYLAEYTFAEGYPVGLSCEVIAAGTLNILYNLVSSAQASLKDESIDTNSIFRAIEKDINSFEIESVIAPEDFRMARLDFSCSSKEKFLCCSRVWDAIGECEDVIRLINEARSNVSVLHTVPSFYNIQVSSARQSVVPYIPYSKLCSKESGKNDFMPLQKFCTLVKNIAEFSESAVISLSAWGDPLTLSNIEDYVKAVLEFPCLSVLIETDALSLTEEKAKKIYELSTASLACRCSALPPVIWIVDLDAITDAMYSKIHTSCVDHDGEPISGQKAFSIAIKSLEILSPLFPNALYPQMTRMNDNEEELEAFYRYWKNKDSKSFGNVIIQKYDNFCGELEDKKPADLSPLNRGQCWHLKRDMVILLDGKVPVCYEYKAEDIVGNVFESGIEEVWSKNEKLLEDHIKNIYPKKCESCDEYYTYNF